MKNEIKDELEIILSQTTQLSFPFLANNSKKQKCLEKAKQEIEDEIFSCLEKGDRILVQENKESIWKSIEKKSEGEFESLPGKLRLNSFYLQEVMHNYVEAIISLLSKTEGD